MVLDKYFFGRQGVCLKSKASVVQLRPSAPRKKLQAVLVRIASLGD